MRKQVLKLGMWSSVLQIARVGINGAVFLILARWLPIREVGLFGTSMSIIAFAQIFVRLGVMETYIREDAPTSDFKNTSFWLSCCIGSAAAFAILIIGVIYLFGTDLPRQGWFIIALAVVPLIDSIGIVPEAMMRRDLTFKVLALRTFTASAVSGFVAIAMGALGYGGWALVSFTLITSLLSSAFAMSMCGWRPNGRPKRKLMREILTPALQITMSGFASASIVPTTQLLVGVIAGPTAGGAYAIAQRFLALANAFVIEPARQVALPLFAGLNNKLEAQNRGLLQAIAFLSVLAAPMYIGAFSTTPELLRLVLNSSDQITESIFRGLTWSFGPTILSMLIAQLLTAISRSRDVLTFTIIQALANVLVSGITAWCAVEEIGWAFSLRAYLLTPIVLLQAYRFASVNPKSVLREILRPMAAGFVMMCVVFLIREYLVRIGISSQFSLLFGEVISGALSYPLALRFVAPHHFNMLKAPLGSLFRCQLKE